MHKTIQHPIPPASPANGAVACSLNKPAAPTAATGIPPEFFPLPSRGRDPHFGCGRSWYYDSERHGLLRLVRLRKPGNLRGKVLVPYADTAELIRRMGREAAPAAPVPERSVFVTASPQRPAAGGKGGRNHD